MKFHNCSPFGQLHRCTLTYLNLPVITTDMNNGRAGCHGGVIAYNVDEKEEKAPTLSLVENGEDEVDRPEPEVSSICNKQGHPTIRS